MKNVLKISRFGGPEVFKWIEVSKTPLTPTSVRVQVNAAGVNFADIMMRMGLYPEAPKPPFTPGYEIAGQVTEVGSEVGNFKIGDRVLGGTRFGGYTDEIVIEESYVRKIPTGLSDIEAAAIPVNFLTAWVALHDMARVRKGDRVLIQSAAGGVGVAAVQMAAQVGAIAVGLVSSKQKFDLVHSLGAKEVYTYDEWESLKQRNFQIVLDSTGGASLKKSYQSLAPGGRVVSFGVSAAVGGKKRSLRKLVSLVANTSIFTAYKLMMENKGVFGLNMLQFFEDSSQSSPHTSPQTSQRPSAVMTHALDQLMTQFENGNFKVVVGKIFPFQEGGAAHSYLQSRANVGKIVLTRSS